MTILSPGAAPALSPSLQEFQQHYHAPWQGDNAMYTRFMFKKTLVVVGCLLALIVLAAHWHTIARFLSVACNHGRGRNARHGTTSDQEEEVSEEGDNFKAEQQGADRAPLKPIRMVKFGKKHSSECTICLCDFRKGEKIGVLQGCNHCFHRPCIEMWLFSHSSCPLCRHSLTELV